MKFWMTLLVWVMCLVSARAQAFEAHVQSDTVLLGNYTILVFEAKDVEGSFSAPELSEFDMPIGPEATSNATWVNGQFSSSAKYLYYIQPRETGTYKIGPATIKTKEGLLQSEPITLHVLPNPDGIITQPDHSGVHSWMKPTPPPQRKQKEVPGSIPPSKLKRI